MHAMDARFIDKRGLEGHSYKGIRDIVDVTQKRSTLGRTSVWSVNNLWNNFDDNFRAYISLT